MRDRDLVFYKNNKLYVIDGSAWISEGSLEEASHPLALATVKREEVLGSATKPNARAVEAKDFVRRAGFPSQEEAVHLSKDGNFDSMPINVIDIRTGFHELGEHTASIRGKMTKRKVSWSQQADPDLIEENKMQIMITDVMEIDSILFLLSIFSPLDVTFSSNIPDTKEEAIVRAIQAQLDLLHNWQFDRNLIVCDPQSGLVALKNKFPGVAFDIARVGDHLPKLDINMRRVQETYRCVTPYVPWNIPKLLANDLVKYSVSRINTRRSKALSANVFPRVKLTGRKVNYCKEYGIGFGDYAEVKRHINRRNTPEERSEPCIALYPEMNLASSWVWWNIGTKRRVRRSIYKVCKTNNLVIDAMNLLSGI